MKTGRNVLSTDKLQYTHRCVAFSERNIFHDQRSSRFNVDQPRRAASTQDGTYWTANRHLALNSQSEVIADVREQVDDEGAGGGCLRDRLLELGVCSHLGWVRQEGFYRRGQ